MQVFLPLYIYDEHEQKFHWPPTRLYYLYHFEWLKFPIRTPCKTGTILCGIGKNRTIKPIIVLQLINFNTMWHGDKGYSSIDFRLYSHENVYLQRRLYFFTALLQVAQRERDQNGTRGTQEALFYVQRTAPFEALTRYKFPKSYHIPIIIIIINMEMMPWYQRWTVSRKGSCMNHFDPSFGCIIAVPFRKW